MTLTPSDPATTDGQPSTDRRLGRRQLLVGGALAAAGGLTLPNAALAAPTPRVGSRRGNRRVGPSLTSGVQAGDVGNHGATIWARADGPGRMWVETKPAGRAGHGRRFRGPRVGEASDFTGQLHLPRLPHDGEVEYRVWFEGDRGAVGESEVGRFRTPRGDAVRFVWSGDCAGQGWGINPDWDGMRGFEAMLHEQPDFFLNSGDTVYADGPLLPEVTLADGTIWRNITTPEKSKVAETLAEYRGQWRYNLMDEHLRNFNAHVPIIAQWDDHEVVNNWYPGEVLTDPRYTETSVDVLAARAAQAFHEYYPISPLRPGPVHRKVSYGPLVDVFVLDMRTFRGPNTPGLDPSGPGTQLLGPDQVAWLERGLRSSRAVWKVIASDMPIGLIVPDGPLDIEAVANREPGSPLGRELEIAHILATIKQGRVANVVWLTADVHYAAAHHYDPARAAFSDFDPFWEFVAGPINAGTFGPNTLDATFGGSAEFVEAAVYPNQPPSDGRQYYGVGEATRSSIRVELKNIAGATLFAIELAAHT